MSQPDRRTLADFVAIAISPVLIMALVGSLIFFLVEVLYVGQYEGSLLYILFFYVFGAVLVSRMAMTQESSNRATIYGLVLGAVTWLGLQRFVEYPSGTPAAEWGWAFHIGFIALSWWCAHRLTWDCTMIEDEEDASGAGLLQAAGLENARDESASPTPEPETKPGRKKDRTPAFIAWWLRYQRYREERRRRPRTPGVWVVYFSLAALPLYGLGQSLIPPEDTARRRYVFWLMTIYVASGLGLLLTTCFLGLRRYLRQRKATMPKAMTGVWLLTGVTFILLFLVLGVVLPRPSPEYALVKLPWQPNSQKREASRSAVRGNEAGEGEGRPGAEGKKDEQAGAEGNQGKQQGEPGRVSARRGEPGRVSARRTEGGQGEKNGKRAAKGDKKGQSARNQGGRPGERPKQENKAGGGTDRKQDSDQRQGSKSPTPSSPSLPQLSGQLARILKWIVLIVFGLVIAFLLLRALLRFLANFTGWASQLLDSLRAFWESLWGRRKVQGEEAAGEGGERPFPPVPFSSFADPFQGGRAERMSPAELVRYSFEALQAWAQERKLARQPGETPLEFVARLAGEAPVLEESMTRLADYYTGLAYARRRLGDECRQPLREFWQVLIEVAERPLSAAAR
jgi:hypothetical protein